MKGELATKLPASLPDGALKKKLADLSGKVSWLKTEDKSLAVCTQHIYPYTFRNFVV